MFLAWLQSLVLHSEPELLCGVQDRSRPREGVCVRARALVCTRNNIHSRRVTDLVGRRHQRAAAAHEKRDGGNETRVHNVGVCARTVGAPRERNHVASGSRAVWELSAEVMPSSFLRFFPSRVVVKVSSSAQ
jgi:hypothetical protein